MVSFEAIVERFGPAGDKTGWFVLVVPADFAESLQPGNRKGFRVKGTLDKHRIAGVSLIPIGDGSFIIPFNASMRKGTAKGKGSKLTVKIALDKTEYQLNNEFLECLADDPDAQAFFQTLTKSHQNYFSKWIDTAKTDATKAKRIAQSIIGLSLKQDYGAMIRSNQKKHQP